ncbi:ParB/RepB/Spo0J family partition protein [Cellulosimicrobium cellulans]
MSPVIDLDTARIARTEKPATDTTSPLLDLPVTQIVQHPLNPSARSDVDEDLAADIRSAGEIYERLVVRPAPGQDGKYELLSGHRRFAAAQHLAMLFVPVRVVDMDDVAAATFLLRANQNRRDLTLVEEAVMVQGLLDLPDAPTQHALAESLGRSDTWISRRAKIARKPEPVLSALADSGSALTFDEVEVLDEFDDSPDLQAKIAAAHGTHEWNYEVNQARQARRAVSFYSEAGDVLRKAGVDVQDSPDAEVPDGLRHSDYLWEGSNAEKLVKKLGMGEGWWARPYRYQTGYTLWRPITADELEEEARRDARDAEARALRETEAAEREARERSEAALRAFAETTAALRNDFVRGLVDGKTLDRNRDGVAALVHFAADLATGSLDGDLALGGYRLDLRDSLATWFGIDLEAEEAAEAELVARLDKLPSSNALLAAMAAEVEPYITPSSWAYSTDDDSYVAAWYRLLVALGYEPSTVETEALAGRLPEADS